jgi:peptide/nickel transport system permease protein
MIDMKIVRKLLRNPLSCIGLILLLFFTLIALFAPLLAPPQFPMEPYKIPRDGFGPVPQPPNKSHPFGTTSGQYDIYYGVVWGTRTAFRVGFIVTAGAALIGVILGSMAGYYGGLVEEIIMRIADIFWSFPFLVATMVLTTVLGRGLDKVMIALVVFGWPLYARLIRGEILSQKEKEYIEAAKAVGSGNYRIILKHILPNTIYPVLIQMSMQIGTMVVTASTLSFFGLGAPEGYADWGQLISFSRNWILGPTGEPFKYWYTITIPGIAIVLFVLSWNLVGDAFRDVMDPKLR